MSDVNSQNIENAEHRVIRKINQREFACDEAFARFPVSNSFTVDDRQVDYHFALPGEPASPDDVFDRVRWGGQVVVVSRDSQMLHRTAQMYQARSGFMIETGPRTIRMSALGSWWPFARQRWHYLVARKAALIRPGQTTDRFTFHVELVRTPRIGGYGVLKRVPSYGSIMVRLKQRFPETPHETLANRAKKLVDKIFPVFLTRETAFLRLLQRDLPEEFRHRVPSVVGVERSEDGLARKLCMNWLRLGTKPISQMDFALQAAELVRVLHDQIHIVHLDLRMDNIEITDEGGVCFVDFGSAVRMDEDLSQSPMLNTLFTEMMSTSQIQRLLGNMKARGDVTSEVLTRGHQKIDKAADLFYLAMQIARPHTCPELTPLIKWDPASPTAREIAKLTKRILQPADPANPDHKSADDILRSLRRIQSGLGIDPARVA
jgi:hypothetical protein